MIVKLNTEFQVQESELLVFNAFSRERFFDCDDVIGSAHFSASIDKLAGIDEMLSANITELTHKARHEKSGLRNELNVRRRSDSQSPNFDF